jgi:hypothetical protein
MPNKCLHRVRLQILDPKRTFTTQNEWKFLNKIVSIQTTQQKNILKTHTCTQKKNSQNNFKTRTQKRTNIWKIVSKNVKQQETKSTHT